MAVFIRDKSFYKRFFVLMLTIALKDLISFGVNLTDNVMLGSYSVDAMSGVALVNQVQFLLQMIVGGVSEGVVVIASQYWGKKDTESINRIIATGLRIGIVAGLIINIVTFCFPEQCLGLLTDQQHIISEGAAYMRIVCFSYVLFSITMIMMSSLRSVETVNIGFYVSITTLIMNMILNYIFIFGKFGAPELGARGAAIATLASRVAELVIVIVYIFFFDKKLHFKLKYLVQRNRELFRDYIRVAMPVITSNAIWGIGMGVQTSILGHIGEEAIAANSIATTLFQIFSVMVYASAGSAGVMIGKAVGEDDIPRVKQYAKTFQVLFLGIGLFSGFMLFFGKDLVLMLYDIPESSMILARQFLTVLSVTLVGTSYQMPVLCGIVRGGGDTKFVLINDMIFIWLVVIPLSALAAFVFELPPVVVFACLKCDQILKCFVAIFKVRRYSWIRRLTRQDADLPITDGPAELPAV